MPMGHCPRSQIYQRVKLPIYVNSPALSSFLIDWQVHKDESWVFLLSIYCAWKGFIPQYMFSKYLLTHLDFTFGNDFFPQHRMAPGNCALDLVRLITVYKSRSHGWDIFLVNIFRGDGEPHSWDYTHARKIFCHRVYISNLGHIFWNLVNFKWRGLGKRGFLEVQGMGKGSWVCISMVLKSWDLRSL